MIQRALAGIIGNKIKITLRVLGHVIDGRGDDVVFHGKKRGLHDLISGTIVIMERSPVQEALSREEFESSIANMDEIQTQHHGL